jgi:ferredoxin
MIVAKRKPIEEIKEMLKGYKKVLNVGCGTCVAVCLAGGEKEVEVLNAQLDMARKLDGRPDRTGCLHLRATMRPGVSGGSGREGEKLRSHSFHGLRRRGSIHCGAISDKPVFPAVDTTFIGVNQGVGWYEERCRSCSSCVLGLTGGVCPSPCAPRAFSTALAAEPTKACAR